MLRQTAARLPTPCWVSVGHARGTGTPQQVPDRSWHLMPTPPRSSSGSQDQPQSSLLRGGLPQWSVPGPKSCLGPSVLRELGSLDFSGLQFCCLLNGENKRRYKRKRRELALSRTPGTVKSAEHVLIF